MAVPKKPAAKAAQAVGAADPAATTGATPGTQIAPPAAETMQSEQDGAGAADSSIPAAIDPAAPTFTETVPVAALAPADTTAAAIASQLVVEGEPNPDLVEAVRQYLASSAFNPPVAADPALRLGFPVLMHLDLDLDKFGPGEVAFVTEGEFETLQKAKVFSDRLEWEDGAWPEGLRDGED